VQQIEQLNVPASPDGLKNAIAGLSPGQVAAVKAYFGISNGALSNISADRIAYWAQQAQAAGVDWANLPVEVKEYVISLSEQRVQLQRVIDINNPPFAIDNLGIKKIVGLTYGPQFQLSLPPAVLTAAQSVGKIEDSNGTLIGTAWVIKDGIVATNCHVALPLLGAGLGSIPASTVIDFSGTDSGDKSLTFAVTGTAFVSSEKGFDVALLTVSKTSVGSAAALPPPLHLRNVDTLPIKGYSIGYATRTLHSATFDTDQLATAIPAVGRSAKIGSTANLAALVAFGDFSVLLHDASTHFGSSGSPLLDENGNVLSIHDCCNVATDFTGGNSCASTTAVTPFNNQSITVSSFAKVADIQNILAAIPPSN
jgi:S1-C subfamily serine protease